PLPLRQLAILALVLLTGRYSPAQQTAIGHFERHAYIGDVMKPGSVEYDEKTKSYTIAGGGENMWATRDALHFVWKRESGDVSLAADISLLGAGCDPHREACVIPRR